MYRSSPGWPPLQLPSALAKLYTSVGTYHSANGDTNQTELRQCKQGRNFSSLRKNIIFCEAVSAG